ncbi:MAG: hypothetical protein Q8P02_04310, partial [Candidatus Micrarchaeota archaeon]|nr:hypothetical protein [Candidatus Micrarchaeota archaeon]
VAVVSGLVSFVFSGLAQASGPLQTVLVGLNLAVSIALALAFLFVEYAVVIRNRDALDGIGQSVHLFREKPAEVAVAFLVSLLAALGLYLAAFVVLAVLALIVAGAAGFSMPTLLSWAVPLLAVVAPLLLLAHFFIQAFQHHLLAHLFLDLTAAPKTAPVLRRAPARKAKAPAHKKARRSGK